MSNDSAAAGQPPSDNPYAMRIDDFGRGAASWQHYAGAGERTIHFAPANGMPAATYLFFIEMLARHGDVKTMDNRGAWPGAVPPTKKDSWFLHVEDFLAFARQQYDEPVHYVGHSMGASVGLLAALRHPEMFASITMIDPGTLPNRWVAAFMRIAPERARQAMPMIKSTRARRRCWPAHDEFIDYIRQRRTYRDFTERALYDYAYGGLQEGDEGLCLRFLPEWEAYNFTSTHYVWPLMHKLTVPSLLVRGAHSTVFPAARFAEINRKLQLAGRRETPAALQLLEVAAVGHMLPQEDAEAACNAVLQCWQRADSMRRS